MSINTCKTKVMHVRRPNKPRSEFGFACGGSDLEYCNEYKYLGVFFNEFLDVSQSIAHVATSARKALSCIIARSKFLGGLMYNTYTQLFNSLVLPVIDYSSPVWGNKNPTSLINIQKHAMRFFLGCTKTMPLAAMTGEMGCLPLHYRLTLNMLKYHLKLENNECNITLSLVYK